PASVRETRKSTIEQRRPRVVERLAITAARSARQVAELCPHLGRFLVGADERVRLYGFAERGPSRTRVADRTGDFTQLAQHFRVEEPILGAFCLVDGDAESGDALVERSTLTLDGSADLERPCRGEVVTAPLRLVQCLGAALVRQIKPTVAEPDFGEVEPDHVLDDGVVAIDRYGQAALEIIARFVVVSDLGVKDSEIVEHPRHWLRVARHLEGTEAIGVEGSRLSEVTAHARQYAAILLDHPEQSRVAGSRRQRGGLGVETFRLLQITSSLGDRAETIQSLGLSRFRSDESRFVETHGVAPERRLRFSLLAQQRSLPPQHLWNERVEALSRELRQSVVVQ